ncbi:NB-ARC domains-containing protein [Artemisia annua]|uniref:NB-ARC domains-containing protein n=1 Tax=Artemisia annua TaxID=35608 RepID=A0A2U1KMX1_ARTAN|nr:NB-ARC domains-containing protein [Artemisia annua]
MKIYILLQFLIDSIFRFMGMNAQSIIEIQAPMNAQSIIEIQALPLEEAMVLFKGVVGDRIQQDFRLEPLARKLVQGYGGWPLIIQVVRKALKNITSMEWEAAVDKVEKNSALDIDDKVKGAFIHPQVSYEYLHSEEAKTCFLLCAVFPEDFNVSVGLKLFHDLRSMEDARDRVQWAVKILKSSSLLLDGRYEHESKMHDVVREVALLIAWRGDIKYMVDPEKGFKEWMSRPDRIKSYIDIFLAQENKKISSFSNTFTKSIKTPRVIDLEINNISWLRSLKALKRLRLLNLGVNRNLVEVRILGKLK